MKPKDNEVDIIGCRPFEFNGRRLQRIGSFLDESDPNRPIWMHRIKDLDSHEVKVKDYKWLLAVCKKVLALRKQTDKK